MKKAKGKPDEELTQNALERKYYPAVTDVRVLNVYCIIKILKVADLIP